MNITITLNAPELASAINALGAAIFSTGIKVVDNNVPAITAEGAGDMPGIHMEEEPVTIKKVREVLTAKSQEGKLEAIKELINKYGGSKLTDIDPSKYVELLKEVELL